MQYSLVMQTGRNTKKHDQPSSTYRYQCRENEESALTKVSKARRILQEIPAAGGLVFSPHGLRPSWIFENRSAEHWKSQFSPRRPRTTIFPYVVFKYLLMSDADSFSSSIVGQHRGKIDRTITPSPPSYDPVIILPVDSQYQSSKQSMSDPNRPLVFLCERKIPKAQPNIQWICVQNGALQLLPQKLLITIDMQGKTIHLSLFPSKIESSTIFYYEIQIKVNPGVMISSHFMAGFLPKKLHVLY